MKLRFRRKLITTIPGVIHWDTGAEDHYRYYLYEGFLGRRSFEAHGFVYDHMITKMGPYLEVVHPWLRGEPLEPLASLYNEKRQTKT